MKTLLLLVLLAGQAFAQFPAPRDPIAITGNPVDPELQQVEGLMRIYQHRFKLDNWKLSIHLTTKAYILQRHGSPAMAMSEWDVKTRTGEIWVMRLSEYTPEMWEEIGLNPQTDIWSKADQRDSVVHEMVHCVISYADNEAAVAMLTGAIAP